MDALPSSKNTGKLKIMFIGAHPDDSEFEFGGTAIKILRNGGEVLYLAMTNGDKGHQTYSALETAIVRAAEANSIKEYLDLTDYIILPNPDTELQATIQIRNSLIREIRKFAPDIIVTHRLNDYHSDHRQTAQLVQDSMYLIAVPGVEPDVPSLNYNPVVLYHFNDYKRPYNFKTDIIVDITDVMEEKMKVLSLHKSQIFEWIPFIEGFQDRVPDLGNEAEVMNFLLENYGKEYRASKFSEVLVKLLGLEKAASIKYVEAFEVAEFADQINTERLSKLMPFAISNLEG